MLKPSERQTMVEGDATRSVDIKADEANEKQQALADFEKTYDKNKFKDSVKQAVEDLKEQKIDMTKSLSSIRWGLSRIPSYVTFPLMLLVFVIIFITSATQGENSTKPLSWVAILGSVFIICTALARLSF